jgi:hypothetical protein
MLIQNFVHHTINNLVMIKFISQNAGSTDRKI